MSLVERRTPVSAYHDLLAIDRGEILVAAYPGPLGLVPLQRADPAPESLGSVRRMPARPWLVFDSVARVRGHPTLRCASGGTAPRPKPSRVLAISLLLLTTLSACTTSRSTLAPGDRLRIRTIASDTTVVRTYERAEGASLLFSDGDASALSISDISSVERLAGTRPRNAWIGPIAGLLVGGYAAWRSNRGTQYYPCNDYFPCAVLAVQEVGADFLQGLAGAATGAVVGALIGSMFRTENWVVVPLLEIRPW